MVGVVVRRINRAMRTPARCRRWLDLVHDPFIEGDHTRADHDWDWAFAIPQLTFAVGVLRRPRMFQLCMAGSDFPLGMVALLENERWIDDQSQPAVYVWYLTGAPSAAVVDHGGPKLLTAAVLDIAVALSLNGRAQGRLWLHADPGGGPGLLDWYSNRGLEPIAASVTLPSPVLAQRRNDGRYFQLTPRSAISVSNSMDAYRS